MLYKRIECEKYMKELSCLIKRDVFWEILNEIDFAKRNTDIA